MFTSPRFLNVLAIVAATSVPLSAQTRSLDQVNPTLNGTLSGGTLHWQQQVRAGRNGQLMGLDFGLTTGSQPGETFVVRILPGPGWSASMPFWEGTGVKTTPAGHYELVYFDVSSAGIQLALDDVFVIDFEAIGPSPLTGFANGSSGYPEPLFLNGNLFSGGHRLCFRTWMDGGLGTRYCVGGPSSASGQGAALSVEGSTSIGAADLILIADRVPDTSGLFYFGQNQIQFPFGDGFRCIGGQVFRLPIGTGAGYFLTYELDYDIPQAASIVPGSTWNFQAWFRDPGAGGTGFNLSDAIELSFTP